MLEFDLFCYRAVSGPHFHLRGTMSVVAGGRAGTYVTTLFDHHDEQFARGVLPNHPRWSEPLVGVLARGMDVALERCALERWFDYRYATLNVRLNGSRVLEDFACANRVEIELSVDSLPNPFADPMPPNPWDVARLACTSLVWECLLIPPMPGPLQLPVYDHGAVRYCRSSDLPEEARELFDRWSFGCELPAVPDVPDEVFESEMNHFLGAKS